MSSKAYGSVTLWGFSPALNLLEVLSSSNINHEDTEELNFLIVGAGDGRHILKTISKLYHLGKKINFFIVENDLETVARQILLINIFLEPSTEYSLQEKTELFMELYGNTLIREFTNEYLCKSSDKFIKWVTEDEVIPSTWNISNLKYKERDQLEAVLKFWRNRDEKAFDVNKSWDYRLREYLGTRYDVKENAFDWTYSMQLKNLASIIDWHEYKQWRETGIAFKMRDASAYKIPNKTFASALLRKSGGGDFVSKRGYRGDILIGPFVGLGIESQNKSLFVKNNDIHVKTSTDITRFNVMSLLHEIYSDTLHVEPDELFSESNIEELNKKTSNTKENLNNVTITILSPLNIAAMCKKSQFAHKFSLISFSNSMVHLLDAGVSDMFAENSLLIIESTRFMLDIRDDSHEEYAQKITAIAHAAKCKPIKDFNSVTNDYAVFRCERSV